VLPPAVMWVDPGLMTGIAMYTKFDEKLDVDEYPFQRAGEVLWNRMMHYRSSLTVGWERFIIMPDTHKLTPQPEAIEIIGVTKFLAGVFNCRTMTPANPMSPDVEAQRRLKALGWWLPGKNDAQSAANHMLAWMLKANELPPRMREMIRNVT
jgi:hypothetical protein